MSSSVVSGGGCRRERIIVDELGLVGVGDDGWIKSNQINCSKWMVAWHGMAWHGMAWHGMVWHGMAWWNFVR